MGVLERTSIRSFYIPDVIYLSCSEKKVSFAFEHRSGGVRVPAFNHNSTRCSALLLTRGYQNAGFISITNVPTTTLTAVQQLRNNYVILKPRGVTELCP